MTTVVAPSRLHFGLLNLPCEGHTRTVFDGQPSPVRAFGGVGLMVEQPGLTVQVIPASEWSAQGTHANRALAFAQKFMASLPTPPQPFRVVVQQAPPEHTGLGVGTQLGLAVAKALAVECGHAAWSASELAQRVGRGERSAIGVHGFERGGLIIEAGKCDGETISPLVAHLNFPATWCVLLLMPESETAWHGHHERLAFAKLSKLGPTPTETDILCRLILTGIMPALTAANFDLFSAALHEFNARVGDIFAGAQGGRYGSPAITNVVQRLRQLGIRGVGQSSWGPTVFAILRRDDVPRVQQAFADIPHLVTQACPSGAHVLTPSLS